MIDSVAVTRDVGAYIKNGSMTKIERYKWTIRDKQGEFALLHKDSIIVDPTYQREEVLQKIQAIASDWSWVAFGAVIIGLRPDGSFAAIDGQHRILAARRRADISLIPCMVFEMPDLAYEAEGFLSSNTLRRPLLGFDKHKAKVLIGSQDAVDAEKIATSHGYKISKNSNDKWCVKAVALIEKLAAADKDALDATFCVMAKCLNGAFAHEKLLSSFHYLHSNKYVDLFNVRTQQAITSVGFEMLLAGINRASGYYSRGGAAVWADGLSQSLNKGRRIPISTYKIDT